MSVGICQRIFLPILIIQLSYSFQYDCDSSIVYPPLNQTGPLLTVPQSNLSEHLKCYPGEKPKKRWLLFLPGSTEQIEELYNWNWIPLVTKKRWSYCTLDLPDNGLGDLQIAAEFLVYAIRQIFKTSLEEKEKGSFR